jgi:hypothetical protein
MPTTSLKGIHDIGESTLNDQLEANLISYFDWGLLGIGAFFNVRLTDGIEAKLMSTKDPNLQDGQTWRPFRNNIVWETNIGYTTQPIRPSGVYVSGNFIPDGSGMHIDYVNGQVVFDTPIPVESNVQMEFSYRYFNFVSADVKWFREVMYNSFRVDENKFFQIGSGVPDILSQNRVQLPAVVVESIPRRSFIPYQIGGGYKVDQDVLFHIFTENPWDRKTILDVITYQIGETINSFDKNAVAEANAFPFLENGAISPTAIMYPQIIQPAASGGFPWKSIQFKNMATQETISLPPLHQAVVRGTFELIFPEL